MRIILLKTLVALAYVAVLCVNFLANYLPFNNRSTGEISDQYKTLFTPSGFTFSIWGIIYLMVGAFVVQVVIANEAWFDEPYVAPVLIWFLVSCVFNMLWLVMWHYDRITLSMIVMLGLLISLLMIFVAVPSNQIVLRIAFGLYAGWISVATIVNVAVLLVHWDVPFFQDHASTWFLIVVTIGVLLCGTVLYFSRDVVYGLVFLWAYFGIWMKYVSQSTTLQLSKASVTFVLIAMTLIAVEVILTFMRNQFHLFGE